MVFFTKRTENFLFVIGLGFTFSLLQKTEKANHLWNNLYFSERKYNVE